MGVTAPASVGRVLLNHVVHTQGFNKPCPISTRIKLVKSEGEIFGVLLNASQLRVCVGHQLYKLDSLTQARFEDMVVRVGVQLLGR